MPCIVIKNRNGELLDVAWRSQGQAYDLRGAYLRNADLRNAYLRGADLRNAYLRNAYLRGADLRNAYLRDVNLRDVNLGDANLRNADLRGADLGGAYLRNADLRGADLGGAGAIIDAGQSLRGYRFIAVQQAAGFAVAAGCHWFTDLQQAREHWASTNHAEELAKVEYLAKAAAIRGWTNA